MADKMFVQEPVIKIENFKKQLSRDITAKHPHHHNICSIVSPANSLTTGKRIQL